MQYAKLNGLRRTAEPKLKALCEHCNGEVLAKCGSKIIWHWAHISVESCDSWYEPETLWHRNWKNKFGSEYSEKSLVKDGERHIADVLTKDNIVIEFQNSPISAETIRAREAFYDRMIWIINGAHFKKNFTYFDKDFLSWELKSEVIENTKLLKTEPNARVLVIYGDKIVHNGIHEILLRLKFIYDKRENIYRYDLMNMHSATAIKERTWAEVYKLYSKNKTEIERKTVVFSWNKPRISWQDAQKPVFIDFNDDYLIWVRTNIGYNEGEATKVSKKDFFAKYNSVD